MNEPLTVEMLERAAKTLRNTRSRPNVLIVSPETKARLDYIAATKAIWELPGYVKRRGPDGKTWIEKKWPTTDVADGGGHKAMRRAGLPVRVDDGWY